MAIKPDYSAGVATLANGGTTVTFSAGANITAADIQPGDTFHAQNLVSIIATVTDATHIELTAPWTGTALAAAPYRIRYQPDGSRSTAALRDLVAQLSGGSVAALQSLTGAVDKIPYFIDASIMALADFKAWTRSLFGLTMAANKLPYGTGANTMDLADFTAQARALLNLSGTAANGKFPAVTGTNAAALRDIVGTVSQSGGVPTGALMETGSNYWRFANGLQVAIGSTPAIASVVGGNANGGFLSFPASFSASPRVFATPFTTLPARFSAVVEVSSGNTFRPWLGDVGPGSSLNVQVIYFAIGSWF